ncbi:Pvc16 family protein [Methanosarcina sp.]|uniref:Pvc16 family protein n=1 Tax=Methanosarcina sp. TaxID=2213 RepID=UPI003BB73CDF
MIHDLSQTLKAILEAEPPKSLDSIQVLFDRPDDKFNPTQTTVDLFLYDIREDVELRSNKPTVERQDGKVILHRPPLRVACSYLVTAWPVSESGLPVQELPLQEHYLLSHVLSILSKYPTIQEEFLQGSSLEGQQPPLPMITAHTEGFKNPAEFWTAIGNKMRPSFTVTVTISLKAATPEITEKMVITKRINLGQRTSPDAEIISPSTKEEFFHIGGRITNTENKPVENATVMLPELNIITTTDKDGLYILGPIELGDSEPREFELHVRRSVSTASTKFTITVPASCTGTEPNRVCSNYDLKLQ